MAHEKADLKFLKPIILFFACPFLTRLLSVFNIALLDFFKLQLQDFGGEKNDRSDTKESIYNAEDI